MSCQGYYFFRRLNPASLDYEMIWCPLSCVTHPYVVRAVGHRLCYSNRLNSNGCLCHLIAVGFRPWSNQILTMIRSDFDYDPTRFRFWSDCDRIPTWLRLKFSPITADGIRGRAGFRFRPDRGRVPARSWSESDRSPTMPSDEEEHCAFLIYCTCLFVAHNHTWIRCAT